MNPKSIQELVPIGEFEISSGKVFVTDPCYYPPQPFLNNPRDNVQKGKWLAYVIYKSYGDWGTRDHQLYAIHSSVADKKDSLEWKESGFVGVDSGQAGIFDVDYFNKNEIAAKLEKPLRPDAPWYSTCCNLTLDTPYSAGVLIGGCVSSSGLGDGGYKFYISTCDGKIQGITIVFIPEGEEEEDEK